ncbi:hypothetical protein [Nocardia sp. CA-290969]|uniref:hypothetical protein n=1 Tax=Nocardia sp. CA-290969 TaxID=3239986 RepID=UPI003D94444D
MGQNLPPLPIRLPVNRVMDVAQRYAYTSRQNDCELLKRIAAGLRALPATHAAAQDCTGLPIESCPHGYQVDKIAGRLDRVPS